MEDSVNFAKEEAIVRIMRENFHPVDGYAVEKIADDCFNAGYKFGFIAAIRERDELEAQVRKYSGPPSQQ
jgi:hypothetical protein